MSEGIPKTISLADEMRDILRARAARQSPETDFDAWIVCTFVEDVRLANGVEFDAGELTLCRPAEEKSLALAEELGLPGPLAVWSFALRAEVLINPALVDIEGEELVEEDEAAQLADEDDGGEPEGAAVS